MSYSTAVYLPNMTTDEMDTDSVTPRVHETSSVDGSVDSGLQEDDILSTKDDSKERETNFEMLNSQQQNILSTFGTVENYNVSFQEPTMDKEEEVSVKNNMAGLTPGSTKSRSSNGSVVTFDLETSFIDNKAPPPEVVITTADVRNDEVSLRTHLLSTVYIMVVVVTPFVLLPIIFLVDEEHKKAAGCGYTIAVMAIFWVTESLPIAVTSLLPVILLPALGVMSAKTVSASYLNDTSMIFFGGITGAIAIEIYNVHKRIALLVLRVTGSEPRCLLLGMSLVTWFLSMWISNTATTAMMMTTAQALLQQFRNLKDSQAATDVSANRSTKDAIHSEKTDLELEEDQQKQKQKSEAELLRLGKALSLTVAYSANIGGIASLTGTGPNLVLFAAAQKVFEDVGLRSPLSFSTWMVYALPLSLLLLIAMLMWMFIVFLRCKGGCGCCRPGSNNEQTQKMNEMIRDEYKKLGPITYAQAVVVISFLTLLLAWVTRDLGEEGGWKHWFPGGYVTDSTPCILFTILMFTIPSVAPWSIVARRNRSDSYRRVTPLLTWKRVEQKMPWSLLLMLGGGFAMARGATESGLSAWIGSQLLVFRDLNHWVILLIICYIITFLTEVTSNTAIATVMMPILSQMATGLRLNPLFLMFPGVITTSFAFMLPVATPPNAIVFSFGIVRVIDMMVSGLFLNCISVPILLFATATWGNAFFKFDQMPPEFATNFTIASSKI